MTGRPDRLATVTAPPDALVAPSPSPAEGERPSPPEAPAPAAGPTPGATPAGRAPADRRVRAVPALLFLLLLSVYLVTGGGKGYSIDGAFGYEMARSAFLDPEHSYFRRFRTAFARWGLLMPLLGQPLVLAGDALARVAPERDSLDLGWHRFRVEEWPALGSGARASYAPPAPDTGGRPVRSLALISFLANGLTVPQDALVGEVRLRGGGREVTLPVRAGADTSEWAIDRPDVAGRARHARAQVAGRWIGQPRGNLYVARLALPSPQVVESWELLPGRDLGAAQWHVRGAAFGDGASWTDVYTGERFWSERETRDFFTRFLYATLNAFTTATTAVLVLAVTRSLGYSLGVATLVALGFGLGTMAWPYARLDFSEPAATLFVMVAVWALFRAFPPHLAEPAHHPLSGAPPAGALRPPAPRSRSGAPPAARSGFRAPRPQGVQGGGAPLPAGGYEKPPPGGGGEGSGGARARAIWARGAGVGEMWLGLLASGALLLAIAGKYTSALLALAVLAQWALSSGWWDGARRPAALRFLLALVLPVVTLGGAAVGASLALTGEVPIVLAPAQIVQRLGEDWLALPLWTGLRGLLFSPGKSLFLYSPWLLLAVPGALLMLRRHARHAVLFSVVPAVVVLLYGMKLGWHGGSWGPRYLIPIVPLLAIATAPAVAWLLRRGQAGNVLLGALAALSLGVQALGIAKDPERYPALVREFVVPALPEQGSRLGGRDYWLARGGPGLGRALQSPAPGEGGRGLGYLWGYPDASLLVEVRQARRFTLSLYFVDWDRQGRRQTVTVEDADGTREWELGVDFGGGVWASWEVSATPERPLCVRLRQRGADTAVVSAATFDALGRVSAGAPLPLLDERTRGDWRGRYGSEGYVLFAWRSFNVDVAAVPGYVQRYEVANVGDRPDPRIHVETAEADVLDTPLLYAPAFSPLLGNAWLLLADAVRLVLPARPDLLQAVLERPPWRVLGVAAPAPPRPEFGLGLDFWPTLLYVNYASHAGVVGAMWVALLGLLTAMAGAGGALAWHLGPVATARRRALLTVGSLGLLSAVYAWLQVQA